MLPWLCYVVNTTPVFKYIPTGLLLPVRSDGHGSTWHYSNAGFQLPPILLQETGCKILFRSRRTTMCGTLFISQKVYHMQPPLVRDVSSVNTSLVAVACKGPWQHELGGSSSSRARWTAHGAEVLAGGHLLQRSQRNVHKASLHPGVGRLPVGEPSAAGCWANTLLPGRLHGTGQSARKSAGSSDGRCN